MRGEHASPRLCEIAAQFGGSTLLVKVRNSKDDPCPLFDSRKGNVAVDKVASSSSQMLEQIRRAYTTKYLGSFLLWILAVFK